MCEGCGRPSYVLDPPIVTIDSGRLNPPALLDHTKSSALPPKARCLHRFPDGHGAQKPSKIGSEGGRLLLLVEILSRSLKQ